MRPWESAGTAPGGDGGSLPGAFGHIAGWFLRSVSSAGYWLQRHVNSRLQVSKSDELLRNAAGSTLATCR